MLRLSISKVLVFPVSIYLFSYCIKGLVQISLWLSAEAYAVTGVENDQVDAESSQITV